MVRDKTLSRWGVPPWAFILINLAAAGLVGTAVLGFGLAPGLFALLFTLALYAALLYERRRYYFLTVLIISGLWAAWRVVGAAGPPLTDANALIDLGIVITLPVLMLELLHRLARTQRSTEERLRRNADHFYELYRVTEALIAATTPKEILEAFVSSVTDAEKCTAYLIWMPNGDNNAELLEVIYGEEGPGARMFPGLRFNLDNFQLWAYLGGNTTEVQLIPNVATMPDLTEEARRELKEDKVQALALIPLRGAQGRRGAITLAWAEPHPFSEAEHLRYSVLGPQIFSLIENRLLLRQTEIRAHQNALLVNNLAVGVAVTDVEGRVTEANRKFHEMTGYEQEELGETTIFEMFEMERDATQAAIWTYSNVLSFPVVYHRADGTDFPARMRMTTVGTLDGEPVGLVVSIEDETRWREYEKQLSYQARLLEAVSDAIISVDEKLIIRSWNRAAESIYGWRAEEVIGRDIAEVLKTRPIGTDAVSLRLHVRDTGVWSGEVQEKHKDGTDLYLTTSTSILSDERSGFSGMVTVNRDITRQKMTEKALKASEASSEALTNALPDVILRLDAEGKVLDYGGSTEEITASPSTLLGRTLREVLGSANGLHIQSQQAIQQALESRELQIFEFEHSSDDHSETIYEARVVAISEEEVLAIVRNVTQRRRAEREERTRRQLAEVLRETAEVITSSLTLDDVFERVLIALERVIPHDAANFMLVEDDKAQIAYCRGYTAHGYSDEAVRQMHFSLSERPGLVHILNNDDPTIITDTAESGLWQDSPENAWVKSYLGAPVIASSDLRGILNIDSAKEDAFDAYHIEALKALSGQMAVALQNARLYEQLQSRVQELEMLRRVALDLTAELDLDALLESIVKSALAIMGANAGGIYIYDDEQDALIWQVRVGANMAEIGYVLQRGEGLSGRILETRRPLRTDDYQTWEGRVPAFSGYGHKAVLGVPILRKNELLGVLNITRAPREPAFTEADTRRLTLFAQQAAVAINNARLLEQTRKNVRQLEILNRITRLGATTLELKPLLQALADTTGGIIGADGCAITLWDAQTETVIAAALSGEYRRVSKDLRPFPKERRTLTRTAIQLRQTIVERDVFHSPYVDERVADLFPMTSVLCVPLFTGDRAIGGLVFAFEEPHHFTEGETLAAQQAAELVALAIAKAQAYSNMELEVARRTAELRSANARLIKLTQVKDEFVSNVSHELRTPITSLKLYHKLLEHNSDKTDVYLGRLERETQRLEYIIQGLLHLSQLDQGHVELNREPVDLNILVGEFVEDREIYAAQKDITLEFCGLPQPAIASVDEMVFGQALSVLLTNAITYTEQGGTINVDVVEDTDRDWLGIAVQDNGPGISPEEQQNLFTRFFRGSAAKSTNSPGTGLGLSIAQEIVQRHNGHIEVESVPGDGAVFTIWLPPDDE